jgi:DNA invertase Pin-like site-specific DNA recombinase
VDAKAQFRSMAEPWADTGTSTGRLMIAVLGGLADVERDLIRTRTAEGRSRAQKRGQRMGRPSKLTDAQKAEARQRRAKGAALFGVGISTLRRALKGLDDIGGSSARGKFQAPVRAKKRAGVSGGGS